jgi:hypothetical protein
MTTRVMGRSARFEALSNDARYEVSLALLSDLCDATEHGSIDHKNQWRFSWTPNIDQAITEATWDA